MEHVNVSTKNGYIKQENNPYINMNAYEMLEDMVYSLMREFLDARERDGNV